MTLSSDFTRVHPSVLQSTNDPLQCGICLENFNLQEDVIVSHEGNSKTTCLFHETCLGNWAGQNPTCPIDRTPITSINGVEVKKDVDLELTAMFNQFVAEIQPRIRENERRAARRELLEELGVNLALMTVAGLSWYLIYRCPRRK